MNSTESTALFARLTERAKEPVSKSDGAAGFDLYSVEDITLMPYESKVVMTDICIQPPENCYAKVTGRSGLALHHNIFVHTGTIDQDYRGNVGVLMINLGKENFDISKHSRIGQLIFQPYMKCTLKEVKRQELEPTERMESGFGSTGVF